MSWPSPGRDNHSVLNRHTQTSTLADTIDVRQETQTTTDTLAATEMGKVRRR